MKKNLVLTCGRFTLSLDKPVVMGIVNVTDDSFSGDGHGAQLEQTIAHGLKLKDEGAAILDIGGESSRPGALPVSLEQELARVIPVIEGLRNCGLPLSVDTVKPEVMLAAIAAGADMINDICALTQPGTMDAVLSAQVAVCLMHMQGVPREMQTQPEYGDVVQEVGNFLASRVAVCENAGIASDRIVIDPGFGFGKSLAHNLALLRQLEALCELGIPLLVGMSRKSMLGQITGRSVEERLPAGIAAHLAAVQRGASILRVHDVAAMVDALSVWNILKEENSLG